MAAAVAASVAESKCTAARAADEVIRDTADAIAASTADCKRFAALAADEISRYAANAAADTRLLVEEAAAEIQRIADATAAATRS